MLVVAALNVGMILVAGDQNERMDFTVGKQSEGGLLDLASSRYCMSSPEERLADNGRVRKRHLTAAAAATLTDNRTGRCGSR
jgi:hypothetical protein